MEENIIVGILIFIIGGVQITRPDLFLRFQIWIQRIVMGAKYEPSKRTYTIVRIIGSILILLSILVLTGILK